MKYCPCLNLQSWEGLQQIVGNSSRRKSGVFCTGKQTGRQNVSKYLFQRKLTSVQSIWKPLTSFGGDCDTGMMAAEAFPARTARISVRYHPTSSSNSESSGFSRRVEQMVGNGGELLTAAKIMANCWFVGSEDWVVVYKTI